MTKAQADKLLEDYQKNGSNVRVNLKAGVAGTDVTYNWEVNFSSDDFSEYSLHWIGNL
jgi:hypothetical protein